MLFKTILVLAAYINLFLYCKSVDVNTDIRGEEYLDYNDSYYNYVKLEEIKKKELPKSNLELIGDNSVHCLNDEDCLETYTPGIQYALTLNSNLVHKPICDYGKGSNVCTCGTYCLSKSSKRSNGESFFYCGPCGRVGSSCTNDSCFPTGVAICEDNYCVCEDGEFYEIYYCYFSYYGYEIALQLAISTCIAIALCLLVASIYNAVGFRRLRRMQDLRHILRSENGVRESPPDDIPPKYDDVVEDLPSYQDAIKMFESSTRNETVGIVNEAFEDDVNSSQEEVRKEDPPPPYNINPEINRKKRYKSHYQSVDCNSNNESNKNHSPSCASENATKNFDKELKTTNQNIRSTPPENNFTESLSLRSENGNEGQYLALRNEEPTHNAHSVAEINTNNDTENSTDEQEDSK